MIEGGGSEEEKIKTIEEWRWSETRGVEIVVSAQTPTPTDNNSPSIKHHLHQIHSNATPPLSSSSTVPTATTARTVLLQERGNTAAAPGSRGPPPPMEVEGKKDGGGADAEKPASPPPVGIRELFRFADNLDYVLMGIGTVGAIVHGTSLPLFLRFFADLVNSFGSNADNVDKMTQEVLKVS